MYNKIYDDLKEEIKKVRYPLNNHVNEIYLRLIYLKYLIEEKKVMNYEEIEVFDRKTILKNNYYSKIIDLFKYDIKQFIYKFKNMKLDDLINDYLISIYDSNNDIMESLFKNKKVISIFTRFYIKDYYFHKIKSDYKSLINCKSELENIEILNEMLNINSVYNDNIDNYDALYINYNYYLSNINDLFKYLNQIKNSKTIYLKIKYNKIYKFKDYILLDKYLDKVIILNKNEKNSDVILIFNYNMDEHDIIIGNVDNYNKQQIEDILNNKDRDYIIKVSSEIIKKNNCIIGFNLYKNPLTKKAEEIYELVDKNSKLTQRLSNINSIIEKEFNNILSK